MSLELRRHSHGSEVLPQCCLRLHMYIVHVFYTDFTGEDDGEDDNDADKGKDDDESYNDDACQGIG